MNSKHFLLNATESWEFVDVNFSHLKKLIENFKYLKLQKLIKIFIPLSSTHKFHFSAPWRWEIRWFSDTVEVVVRVDWLHDFIYV